ncbi:MAG: prolipoprotein diacylglyceryl transferase [Acidimicrobiia bacterium]|nr:prolipoprotein diacylglyceryl transferase [Acidimicrobiia bacterium]
MDPSTDPATSSGPQAGPTRVGHERGVPTLNAWFDRIPRMTITVGHRTIPAFRSIGIAGYHLAFAAALLTAVRTGFPLLVAVGLSAVAGLSFFGWALLRRAFTGVEFLVRLEHVWVATAMVAVYLWLSDAPVLEGLDVLTVGLAPFLAFERIGCLTVGCCHGTPAATGIRYGPAHDHVPPWLVDRRLWPVPLLEAAGLLAIFAVACALIGSRPGTATVWFLAAYSVLRFGTEALRGDERPHVGPVPVARVMAIMQLGAAIWLWDQEVSVDPGLALNEVGASAALAVRSAPIVLALAAGALLVVARSRHPNPLVDTAHVGETWQRILDGAMAAGSRVGPTPILTTTSEGLDIGVSVIGPDSLHVSFHHPDHDTGGLAALLAGEQVTERNGIHHATIRTATGRPPESFRSGRVEQPQPRNAPTEPPDHPYDDYFGGAPDMVESNVPIGG